MPLPCTGTLLTILSLALASTGDDAARADRLRWFVDAKFGLFVHWGPFAVQGGDPNADFDYFDMKSDASKRPGYVRYGEVFRPRAFDAAQWTRIAKAAGMKYVVFTSKHHDGYCLFDSALTDYDSVDRAPKHDFVHDLVPAARAAGLKIGFYYSMLDWHHPDFDTNLPKYVDEYLFGQVRELCTKYGPIDCLWFDGEWDYPAATWRAADLVKMIRALQPGCLINDRLGLGERGVSTLCDFYTREQPSEIGSVMAFEHEKPYAWEACMTIGESWQYSAKDTQFKSVKELLRGLADIVSRGGNLLLNVGPDPDGTIPAPLVDRLEAMGAWLAANGESIYGATRSPFRALPAGTCTAKGNRLYVHLDRHPGATLALPGLQNTIVKARWLNGGTDLRVDNAAKTVSMPDTLPDDTLSVLVVDLDGPPRVTP